MSKLALAATLMALTAAGPLTMGRSEATQLVPAAFPPWDNPTPTTTTEAVVETRGTQPPAATEAGNPTPIQVTTTSILRTTTAIQAVSLRSGPGTGSPVIGTVQRGMTVQVLGSANHGWMQVETPAGSGWTYGTYLGPVDSTVAEHPAPQQIIVR